MAPKSTLNTRYYKMISHGFLVGNLLSCREQNEINGTIKEEQTYASFGTKLFKIDLEC